MTDTAASLSTDASSHYALVIGIGKYREFPPLRSPVKDAVRFCEWLTDKAGVPAANIVLVTGEEPGRPGHEDILGALRSLGLRNHQRKGRRLYIYYAGHGIGPAIAEVGLLPADAERDGLESGRVFGMVKWINHFAVTRMFDEVVMFLDCCRDQLDIEPGGMPWSAKLCAGARDDEVDYFSLSGSNFGGKSFEFMMSNPGFDDTQYRGLMTEMLIEGLNGAPGAVDPVSKEITTASLQRYVTERVGREAKSRGVVQKAQPLVMTGTAMVLVPAQKSDLTVNIVAGPLTANKPLRIQNLRTLDWRVLGQAAEGAPLPPATIAADTRHQLISGDFSFSTILDPSQMGDPHDLQLP